MKNRILFVCMGNICRSPAAEGVMKKKVMDNDLEDLFDIDSAGTIGFHAGHAADRRMQAAAKKRDYDLTSRARQIMDIDLKDFDLILAMDEDNFRDIQSYPSAKKYSDKIKLFCDYVKSDAATNVPDPYYGGADGFEQVLDLVEEGCENILKEFSENSQSL